MSIELASENVRSGLYDHDISSPISTVRICVASPGSHRLFLCGMAAARALHSLGRELQHAGGTRVPLGER